MYVYMYMCDFADMNKVIIIMCVLGRGGGG